MFSSIRRRGGAQAPAPHPATVLFDLTNKCNLRCSFCYFRYDSVFHRPALHTAPAAFARIAAQVVPGAQTVHLSAGCESLVHPRFLELLALCMQHRPPRTVLLTNGQLLDETVVDGLIEHGLSELHVSLDGATRATYERLRRGGSFERLLGNLRHLRTRKRAVGSRLPLLQFNAVLLRSNLEELEGLVDLAGELGAERIACRHLMPYAGLGMERELTSREPRRANERFLAFLEHAQRQGVSVTSFPDFYAVDGQRWELPAVEAPGEAPGPIGNLDQPPPGLSRCRDRVELAGWALAPAGGLSVEVLREASPGERASATDSDDLVPLGRAHFSNGTRPDVARLHAGLPRSWRAGWNFPIERRDLPASLGGGFCAHAVARDGRGRRHYLGKRRVVFSDAAPEAPHLFCRKPFEDVYIDAAGDVYPYPDCQTVEPFGRLTNGAEFDSLWCGQAFEELRGRVVARDPPTMCRTCPDLINRRVDDALFFLERDVEPALRRPLGCLDSPGPSCVCGAPTLSLRGWALGHSPVVEIEIRREHLDGEPLDPGAEHGVLIGRAAPGGEPRPDVAAAFPGLPGCERAGWNFELDSALLPPRQPVRISAVAVNADGNGHLLGTSRVTFEGTGP